jgi:hypothetical protein
MHLYATAETLKQSDRELLAMAVSEALRAFPELKGHFVHGVIRRNEASQPQFVIPTRADSLWVDTPWPGIYACGDWIGYPTPALNMERAVITGMAAANEIIRLHGKEPFPIIPPRRPEAFARGVALLVRLVRTLISPLSALIINMRRRGRDTDIV